MHELQIIFHHGAVGDTFSEKVCFRKEALPLLREPLTEIDHELALRFLAKTAGPLRPYFLNRLWARLRITTVE